MNEYDGRGRLRVYYGPAHEGDYNLDEIPLCDWACYYCREPVLRKPAYEREDKQVLGGWLPPQHVETFRTDPTVLSSVGDVPEHPGVVWQRYHDGALMYFHERCYWMAYELAKVVTGKITFDDLDGLDGRDE